ncbi:MAG TPA: T9SS type A sorting domain-containing protein, partial [Ignavibacteriaceae bacterium]|nr:T9SS type A sorting domain-containing protein [Ignavibacteriaceae bacterium]
TYEFQYDTTAFRIYREAMPGYNIVGVNSNAIIPSLGAIHCIVKEVGVLNPLWISHPKIDGIVTETGPYEINANIKSAAGISDAEVYWTTDTTAGYSAIQMTEIVPDSFTASIPDQINGTEVFYYISASSNDGRNISEPITAPAGYYHFKVEAVPVELISFNGTLDNNIVKLNWLTATETNNKGFEIERMDGSSQNSPGIWKAVGFVHGNGTTTLAHSYSFSDNLQKNVIEGKYHYRLKQVNYDGSFEYSSEIAVVITEQLQFSLAQNYPNPFNPATIINYQISDKNFVSLKVFNIIGEEISVLVNEEKPKGRYSVEFNGSNIPAGVYLYKLTAGNNIAVKKLMLLK